MFCSRSLTWFEMCFTKAMHTLQIPVAQICHLNKPSKVLILQKSCVRSSSVKCPQMPLESFCCSERHRMSNPLWLLITCSICVLPIRMKKKTLCDYWKLNQEPFHFQFHSPIAKKIQMDTIFSENCVYHLRQMQTDLIFVKKFTRPDFRAKKFTH